MKRTVYEFFRLFILIAKVPCQLINYSEYLLQIFVNFIVQSRVK